MSTNPEGQPEVPANLQRFEYADWADDYEPPSYTSTGDWPQLRHIHAFKRFLAARREWEAQTGVHIERSWEKWAADRRASARSLIEINEPYRAGNFIEREDPDPRWGGMSD